LKNIPSSTCLLNAVGSWKHSIDAISEYPAHAFDLYSLNRSFSVDNRFRTGPHCGSVRNGACFSILDVSEARALPNRSARQQSTSLARTTSDWNNSFQTSTERTAPTASHGCRLYCIAEKMSFSILRRKAGQPTPKTSLRNQFREFSPPVRYSSEMEHNLQILWCAL
jgi:hypothetical protein